MTRTASFDSAFEYAVDTIDRVSALGELERFLSDLLRRYGLRHAVYHAVRLPGQVKPNPVLLLTYPPDWVRHYVDSNYFAVDPVVTWGARSIMPLDWAKVPRQDQAARRLFGEASEHGIGRQGMTFPIRGASGDTALLSVTSDLSDSEWQKLRGSYTRDFQVIGHAIHAKVVELSRPEAASAVVPLSPRERECLQWTALGRSMEDIAVILGLSERTVRAYLDSARHKLNCLNRDHAIAKAVSLCLIQPDCS